MSSLDGRYDLSEKVLTHAIYQDYHRISKHGPVCGRSIGTHRVIYAAEPPSQNSECITRETLDGNTGPNLKTIHPATSAAGLEEHMNRVNTTPPRFFLAFDHPPQPPGS